ncbi:MAG TPA: hypothetical protein EYH50_01215 [Pyrodictium delaneyi]|uniref:Uncharacterized protein n=1 Tax=Pyrodictium delaneyi TaxID=1273541 RepID=A0A832ZTM7_9CREN|nr:hypothetical protein [Pyrodictium delaneyi]
MTRPSSPLARGMAVFNAILVPIAACSLYMVYLGATRDSSLLLTVGALFTAISPFLAYAITRRILAKLFSV